jgi:hypothetical protein
MKKTRSRGHRRASQAACTVSAAALMLGVSRAATIGFNFQANYCSAASYTGSYVTATAFGIATNNWQSLTPMDTGYGCTAGYYTLNETIDTNSTTGGLNPLPAGSLNVTWSAYTANVSGFGGYDRNPPHYTFGGNGYHPGNEQVYWGFLRDGVNFGPDSSGGDNNQPGYNIDITGLQSLFGDHPFVVQLIASSDSLYALTNAFIIDATLSSTQSVEYPNIPPIGNAGGAAWWRGVGGGISTVSGSVSTDHLQIAGNRAEHAGPADPTDPTDHGFNNASTIAGFIITDMPVVTMPPEPVTATPGDSITLRAIAIGVPPLAIQWRQNGQPIPGATSLSYVITNALGSSAGDYDLVVTNLYGSATSDVAAVTVNVLSIAPQPFTRDEKPGGDPQDAAVIGAAWLASSAGRDGVEQFLAADADQIVLPTVATNFDYTTGTISFWIQTTGTDTNTGSTGATLFDRYEGAGLIVVQDDDGTLYVQADGSGNNLTSTGTIDDGDWHNIVVAFDQSDSGDIELYIDGVLDSEISNAEAWSWPSGQDIELGHSHSPQWESFDGVLDDFRIYSVEFDQSQVASLFTGALVDTNDLQVQLNFTAAPTPGASIAWPASTSTLQSADVATGPWIDVPAVTSPFYDSGRSSTMFYRYSHVPVSILSNPYDM